MMCRSNLLACGFVATAIVATLVFADDVPTKPVDGNIEWVYSYADGRQLARDTGKPMFVVFRCER